MQLLLTVNFTQLQNVETRLQNGYTEDLRQHLRYEADPAEQRFKQMENGSAVAITTNGDVIKTSSGEALPSRRKKMLK